MSVLAGGFLAEQAIGQATAGVPPIDWQGIAGGNNTEHFRDAVPTTDGAYLCVGYTRSDELGPVKRSSNGLPRVDSDFYIVKVSQTGRILWQKMAGGSYTEEANAVARTLEGGYIVVGHTNSPDRTNGQKDFYIVRMDKLGTVLWEAHYGGGGNDEATCVVPLPDGGFIVGGYTTSDNGDITANRGGADGWVIRLDRDGKLIWERNYGGGLNDFFNAATLADDFSVILVGSSDSRDYDAVGNHGKTDILVVKINLSNKILWHKMLGGSQNDEGYDIARMDRKRFVLCGTTFSNDFDIAANKGTGDFWVVNFDEKGKVLWEATYGGTQNEGANALTVLSAGGLLVGGTTSSADGQVVQYKALYDGWLLKLDEQGNLIWSRGLGGSQKEEFNAVLETPSGDYLGIGYTGSNDFDLIGVPRYKQSDAWLVAVRDPDQPNRVRSLAPTVLMGYVRDTTGGDSVFVEAEVVLVDDQNNRQLYQAKSDDEYGIYQLYLPDTQRLSVGVFAEGYFFISEPLNITRRQRYGEIRRDFYLQRIQKGARIQLHNILFDTGSDNLRPESRAELQRVADFLNRQPSVRLEIRGHTDSTGRAETKELLSELRAKQVKIYLMGLGISPTRLEFVGMGMKDPLGPEDSEYARQLNRRVELVILED